MSDNKQILVDESCEHSADLSRYTHKQGDLIVQPAVYICEKCGQEFLMRYGAE